MRRGQNGITLLGFLIMLVVAGCFAYVAMLLIPMYTEYYQVKKALKGTTDDPAFANMTEHQIRVKLSGYFDVGYVTSIQDKDVKIKREGQGQSLSVDYEVRKQIGTSSIFLVGHFTDTEGAAPGGSKLHNAAAQ